MRLAAICMELNKYNEAIERFEKAISLIDEYIIYSEIKPVQENNPKFMERIQRTNANHWDLFVEV